MADFKYGVRLDERGDIENDGPCEYCTNTPCPGPRECHCTCHINTIEEQEAFEEGLQWWEINSPSIMPIGEEARIIEERAQPGWKPPSVVGTMPGPAGED
jgi:hypothetical protein|tara:strand:+ start:2522 stop:2821 length:300 start_codon:yes stop_codon:yes gene_type:complete